MRLGPAKGQLQQRLDLTEYLDALYGYAIVLSRNSAEAEDLVQETCLRALRGMGRLRSGDRAKSWLFTILRNIWLNQLRHRRTAPEGVEFDSDGSVPNEQGEAAQDPHSVYIRTVEREQVQAAIQQLPGDFREIIILREYEELSYQDCRRSRLSTWYSHVATCESARPSQGVAYVGIGVVAIAGAKSGSDQRERSMSSEHTPSLIMPAARNATEATFYLIGGNILSHAVSQQRGGRCGQHTFGVFLMALPGQVGG